MAKKVLGLDVGGANLKAATADGRARAMPFALWKQPERLPAALAELVAQFPDTQELAVTMTGELCDGYPTKREGVAAIIAAARQAGGDRPLRVWSTEGRFVDAETAGRDHLKVAAANWHALAAFAGRYTSGKPAVLIDIGSTTTDAIPILSSKPVARGATDRDRMNRGELIYTGVRRTPVCSLLGSRVAAEFFATTHDVYLLLGKVAEDPADRDTADGRPSTRAYAHARLSRMLGGDAETICLEEATALAQDAMQQQLRWIEYGTRQAVMRLEELMRPAEAGAVEFILSGSGEFLAREMVVGDFRRDSGCLSLSDQLGLEVSSCAPAYAVAVLGGETDAMAGRTGGKRVVSDRELANGGA